MKITIDVPEMKCAKCDATAPIQPVFLYAKGSIPPQFRDMFTDVVKERADVQSTDDGGRTWVTFTDDKPAGWTKGPGQADLCTACAVLWAETGKAFLTPAEDLTSPGAPETAASSSVKDQPARAPTMSEVLAAKVFESNGTSSNSMMQPTLRR